MPVKKGKIEDGGMGSGCKCSGWGAIIMLIVALLFLIRDVSGWSFWNISGWTVVFFVIGFAMMGHKCCACK